MQQRLEPNVLAKAVRSSPMSLSQIAKAAQIDKSSLCRYLAGKRVPKPAIQSAIMKACNLDPSICMVLAEYDGAALIGSEGHIWLQDLIRRLVPTMIEYEDKYSIPIDPRTAAYCADMINTSWQRLAEKRMAVLNSIYEDGSRLTDTHSRTSR
jgi:hypothetical protein